MQIRALGPDDIPGCVLRDCAEELTDVFNTSLRGCRIVTGQVWHPNPSHLKLWVWPLRGPTPS